MNANELRMPTRRTARREDGLMRSLGAPFALPQPPQSLPEPPWVESNGPLVAKLGWTDRLDDASTLTLLAGDAEPIGGTLATVNCGHPLGAWAARNPWRLRAEGSVDAHRASLMLRVNPKHVLRIRLAEAVIRKARKCDFGEVQRLLQVLQRPFGEQPEHEADAGFPPDWAQQLEVSCSS